eukprot:GGOE01015935.1.p1 GENE.GGOE01015935.1~~GGOE01015935.1.p1  ORF type:complete len:566 (-),score=137.61 GGOE01015935.1:770-2467(-)
MLLPRPEVCHGACAAWAQICGDEIYALEERREEKTPLATQRGATCPHPFCAFRLVTLTTPAFIVAMGPTRENIQEDWDALTAGTATTAAAVPTGVLGRLLAPRGPFPGNAAHKGQSLMLKGLDAGHLVHLHAHESILVHTFMRFGGYLRVLGYPLPTALVGFGLVLAMLAVIHDCARPLCLLLPLLLLIQLHTAHRRHPDHLPSTLQEVTNNMGAATLALAEVGTLLDRVAGILLWRSPGASGLVVLALAAAIAALVAPHCQPETLDAAMRTCLPIVVGLVLYFVMTRLWSSCVVQWLEQARALEQALGANGEDGCQRGDVKKLNGDVTKDGSADGFLPPDLARFVFSLAPFIGPVAGVFGVGMLLMTMILAAVASPDCQCTWMEDWKRFPLLSEAAMYPPQRELFMGTVVGTAGLMYLALAALLERFHQQLPTHRTAVVRMHRTLVFALVNLCGLGLLDMKRFFAPHVITAYAYFFAAEFFFLFQTIFLFQLFAAAPSDTVTFRHRLPLYLNCSGFIGAAAFWYCYTQELPIRSYVEISVLMFQMLSVGASGPLMNERLIPPQA